MTIVVTNPLKTKTGLTQNDEDLDENQYILQNENNRSCVRWRFITAVMAFFGLFNSYSMRNNISVAIVSMVNSTSGTSETECGNFSESAFTVGEFDWDSQTQGIVLSSLYWGYVLPQVLAGALSDKYGAKMVMLVGGIVATVSTLLAPFAARTNLGFFITTRIFCGLGLSVYTPCCHGIISQWCNSTERSKITSFVYAGCQFGTAFTMALSGVLCEYGPDGGWPWAFYVYGIISAVWLVLWWVLVYSSPRENPWISHREVVFIEGNIPKPKKGSKIPVPWKAIVTSTAIWAVVINYFGNGWGYYTLMSQLPSYMSEVLGFNMSSNGLYSSLPYIVNAFYSLLAGMLADYLITNDVLSTKNVRKLMALTAMFFSGVCLLIITFLKCQTMTIYALLVLAVALNGSNYSGGTPNHIDLAPNFAASLQGIVNTFGSLPGIISPYITGVITNGKENQESWSIVFYIAFGILTVFGILFGLLCEGEKQPWNEIKPEEENFDESKSDKNIFMLEETECNDNKQ